MTYTESSARRKKKKKAKAADVAKQNVVVLERQAQDAHARGDKVSARQAARDLKKKRLSRDAAGTR